MIVVKRAPPYLTVQDRGRFGFRASGVPVGGAMDQWSLAIANRLVRNPGDAAALEWAISGGALLFENDCMIAMTGAGVEGKIDGDPVATDAVLSVRAGQLLTIERLLRRRFLYLAVSGGIDCPAVLGSRSTYLPAALGGIEGRRLKTGDRVLTGITAFTGENLKVTLNGPDVAPDYDAHEIRVIPALDDVFHELAAMTCVVSLASDRMGYRLECETALVGRGASITSEPVCAGVIQLPPDGYPIVLMADSPTIGGYRIVGTVISHDLPVLAQSLPGRRVTFSRFTLADATA